MLIFFQVIIEVPPLADVPFPPPLDEGMTEEIWQEHVMTPPPSPEPEKETEVVILLKNFMHNRNQNNHSSM